VARHQTQIRLCNDRHERDRRLHAQQPGNCVQLTGVDCLAALLPHSRLHGLIWKRRIDIRHHPRCQTDPGRVLHRIRSTDSGREHLNAAGRTAGPSGTWICSSTPCTPHHGRVSQSLENHLLTRNNSPSTHIPKHVASQEVLLAHDAPGCKAHLCRAWRRNRIAEMKVASAS